MKPTQLPSGSWRIQIQRDGRRYNFTAKDKETAIQNAEAFLKVRSDVTYTLLGDAIDKYIDLKRNVLSPSTIRGYESIRKSCLPELMQMPLRDLNSMVLQIGRAHV